MRYCLTMILMFLAAVSLSAQDSVRVQVQNRLTGAPLEYAFVNVYAFTPQRTLASSTLTDERGIASVVISSFPADLEVRLAGYDPEHLRLPTALREVRVSLLKRFTSLQEVVITGVTVPVKPQDALSSYKVISAAAIQAQGAVTLNEVLANQLNTSISNDGILGAKVGMQGMGGDKVKILSNGVSLNGREAGNIDLGQVNLLNAERIEIIQGPMSIIYGADALGGVVNVIPKVNRKPWELMAVAHYESVGKYNLNLAASRTWKKHTLSIGAGRNYFTGWHYLDTAMYYAKDTVLAERNMLFNPKEQYLGNLAWQYRASNGLKLDLSSDFLKEKVTDKGQLRKFNPFEVSAEDAYYRTSRSVNRLSLEGKLRSGTWQVMNGYAWYHRVRNTYIKDLSNLSQSLSSADGVQDTSRYHDLSSRGLMTVQFPRWELTAGYDLLFQRGASGKIPGGTSAIDDYAVFALAGMPLMKNDRLKAQLGLRGSYNTKYSVPLVPAVHLLYRPSGRVQLRGSYAVGFRAPSLKEMHLSFVDANHAVYGNENLRPEQGHHGQLSFSYRAYEKGTNYAQLMLTGYYNDVTDVIVLAKVRPQDPADLDHMYANISRQRNTIGTLQLEGQAGDLHYTGGYSYGYTFGQAGYEAFDVQEVNANLFYFWQMPRLGFSLFYKYTGAQPFLRSDVDGSASYEGRQPGYHMMDASLERKFLNRKISLVTGVKNLFDIQTLTATGLSTGGVHSGNNGINFLPRSLFTTLRLTLD